MKLDFVTTAFLNLPSATESPYERDCYLSAPLESQTTGPQSNN